MSESASELLNAILNDPVLRARAIVASRNLGACPMRSESHINHHEDTRVVAILQVFLPVIVDALGLNPPTEVADLAPPSPGDAGPAVPPVEPAPIVPGDANVH